MMRLIWYRIVAVVGARRVPSFTKVAISLAIWLPPSDKIIAFCIDRFSKVGTVRRSLVRRKQWGRMRDVAAMTRQTLCGNRRISAREDNELDCASRAGFVDCHCSSSLCFRSLVDETVQ